MLAKHSFFGGVARFDFIQGERSSFIAYVANDVVLHRTKLEKADAFIKNMLVVFYNRLVLMS